MLIKSICNVKKIINLVFASFFLSCTAVGGGGDDIVPPEHAEFNNYWYSGKAELTRYKLQQARYGEIHEGDAVLIFVTEDFLPNKQVKYEYGDRPKNAESVLKLNLTRSFNTGIYPYSMISSIFTPVATGKKTLKVATSSQEWCGHTYSQLNLRNGEYKGMLHSYFQAEADQEFTVDAVLLEDEIWTKIRLNPAGLPTGEIKLIPGSQFLRLRHRDFSVENATAELKTVTKPELSSDPLKVYRVNYHDISRTLKITFEAEFPYTIVVWEEQAKSGFRNPQMLTTRAVRTHSINSDYWNKNSVADTSLQKSLGL